MHVDNTIKFQASLYKLEGKSKKERQEIKRRGKRGISKNTRVDGKDIR